MRTRVVIALIVSLLLARATAGAADGPGEDRVRAALIYNFAQFIDWPDAAGGERQPFVIGLLGSDAFRPVMDEIVHGKMVDGRRVEIRVFGRPEEVRDCQVLVVALSGARRERALRSVSGSGLLTIGEGADFAREGGMVALVKTGNRIGFDINLTAAEGAGLRVSATLLGLAREVGRWPESR